MSKTIKIPEDYKPNYICEINGVKYSYPAGQTVEVPDDVAEVIENDLALNPTPAPKVVQSDLFIRNTLEWDCNTDGLVSVPDPWWGGVYYKISGAAPNDSELLQGATITVRVLGQDAPAPASFTKKQDGVWESDTLSVLVVQRDNTTFVDFAGNQIFFKEKGIYVTSTTIENPEAPFENIKITFNGYNGFPPIQQIDPKYLPQSAGGGGFVQVYAGLEGDEVYIFKDLDLTEKASVMEAYTWIMGGKRILISSEIFDMSEAFYVDAASAILCFFGLKPGSNEPTMVFANLLPLEG